MANVGGRQLTLGARGLTNFAQTADGRQVQLHIPKYVFYRTMLDRTIRIPEMNT